MKKIYSGIVVIASMLALYACKREKLGAPDFNVTVPKTTYKVGDSVVFSFSGTAGIIQFWSGEPRHSYDNRSRKQADGAVNILTFSTATANLPAGNTGQTDNLHVMASTNFNGSIDSASIRNATWTDITSRSVISKNATTVASGSVDVSDFQNKTRDSLFIAFKYISTPSSNTSRARQYTVSAFTFTNTFPDGTVYNHNTLNTDVRFGGFQSYSYRNTSPKDSLKWNISGTLTMAQGVDNLSDEDWAISKGFNLGLVPPDIAVGIQNSNMNPLTNYVYQFTSPGTYVVTFVASNTYAQDSKVVVKQITLTITN